MLDGEIPRMYRFYEGQSKENIRDFLNNYYSYDSLIIMAGYANQSNGF